uniref:Secreted protein n=1 Tax=Anopheles christyi TaxID=43041 RepID=A0A182JTX1_9DIPT
MFVQRNLVTIVMIPSLIGLHWAWDSLQHNRALVTDQERKDLPVVIAAKALWHQVTNKTKSNEQQDK